MLKIKELIIKIISIFHFIKIFIIIPESNTIKIIVTENIQIGKYSIN